MEVSVRFGVVAGSTVRLTDERRIVLTRQRSIDTIDWSIDRLVRSMRSIGYLKKTRKLRAT